MKKEEPVPQRLLEAYRLSELPRRLAKALSRRIAGSPELQERLAELERSDREILDRYPAVDLLPAIERRAAELAAARARAPAPARRLPPRPAWLAAPLLAALLLALLIPLVVDVSRSAAPDPTQSGLRAKGTPPAAPQLQVFRKRDGRVDRLAAGSGARAGDLLQLSLDAGAARYGVIFSLDGRGQVTLHFPGGEQAARLAPGSRTLLPGAFELDDAPRFERFLLVTAAEPFAVEPVLASARRLAADPGRAATGRLDLPARFGQASVTLVKEPGP